jgi:hypothetical protein
MDSGLEQGGLWAGLGTLIVTLGTVGYSAMRRFKIDGFEDRQVARKEDFVDDLMKRMADLEKRTDEAFNERNRAIAAEATLLGKMDAAKTLMAALDEKVSDLRRENSTLKERIEQLEAIIRKGGGNPPPNNPIVTAWADHEV